MHVTNKIGHTTELSVLLDNPYLRTILVIGLSILPNYPTIRVARLSILFTNLYYVVCIGECIYIRTFMGYSYVYFGVWMTYISLDVFCWEGKWDVSVSR